MKKTDGINKDMNINFIVSSGRTGTQFFEQFFNNNFKKTLCAHEPSPDLFEIGLDKVIRNATNQDICNDIMSARIALFNNMQSMEQLNYIESNPNLAVLLNEVNLVFGHSKYLYITRNPIDTVRSMYSKSPANNNTMFFYAENDHRRRIRATDFEHDPWADQWQGFSRFERICWFWNKVNSLIYDFTQRNGNCLTVKFEDIFQSNNLHAIHQIVEFFQLKQFNKNLLNTNSLQQKINSNQQDFLSDYSSWTEQQKRQLQNITGDLAHTLGY